MQVTDKDKKITELNDMISSLQNKLQDKIKDMKNEKGEIEKFKKLAEEYEDKNIQMQVQLERVGVSPDKIKA
jgi:hypothetical protein